MNLTFQKILMLRTNDLVRWGRISAVILFLTGGICVLGEVICYYVIDYKIVPCLARYTELHQKTIDTFGHGQRSDALREANDNVAKINADLIDVCRSLGIVMMGGSGFLALYSGLLSWRSYELARNVQNAEQDAVADRHRHHSFTPTTLQSRRRLRS